MKVGPGDLGSGWRGEEGGRRGGYCLGEESSLTCTVLVRGGRLLRQLGSLLGPCDSRIPGVQAFGHLFADDVHQALEGLLDVDVVLGTGLKELKACKGCEGVKEDAANRRLSSVVFRKS